MITESATEFDRLREAYIAMSKRAKPRDSGTQHPLSMNPFLLTQAGSCSQQKVRNLSEFSCMEWWRAPLRIRAE